MNTKELIAACESEIENFDRPHISNIARLLGIVKSMQWIPASNKPKDDMYIILMREESGNPKYDEIGMGYYDSTLGWDADQTSERLQVAYYMPLPERPDVGGE